METEIECMFKIQMTIMVPNYLGLSGTKAQQIMRLSKEEMGKKIQDLWYSMRRAIVVEALFLN